VEPASSVVLKSVGWFSHKAEFTRSILRYLPVLKKNHGGQGHGMFVIIYCINHRIPDDRCKALQSPMHLKTVSEI
jgi:hypothetical protein